MEGALILRVHTLCWALAPEEWSAALLDAHGSPRAHWLRRVSRLVCGWLCAKGVLPRCPCGKESACNAGDVASAPGSGRSPGGGNGNLLQYSCLGNPMDRRAWQGTVHGVAKNLTRLSG